MKQNTKLAQDRESPNRRWKKPTQCIGAKATQTDLTALHDQVGNRAVGQLIQAKLTIGAPDDKYEREADRVADQVMRMPEPSVQRTPT